MSHVAMFGEYGGWGIVIILIHEQIFLGISFNKVSNKYRSKLYRILGKFIST